MKRSGFILSIITCLWTFPVKGQNNPALPSSSLSMESEQTGRYTISGYVSDSLSGEELIGATVIIRDGSGESPSVEPPTRVGTVTNMYGYYSITLTEGHYTVVAQFIGYEPHVEQISLRQNTKIDFMLSRHAAQLGEIEISAKRKDENISNTRMGMEKIEMKEIENIPMLLGERDVLKAIQLRPGIKAAGEGNSGFYVRGGAADQNLILLDEATVYNASHLLGFFSVFNADALKNVTLYKGTQPASYGGRLASVLDIRMKEGNNKKYSVSGGLGLISSRLNIEGPIAKDKGSFTVSGRRTYADLFLKLSQDTVLNQSQLYFYDLNTKANYRINENNRIFLSGYFGEDVLGFGDQFGIDWGNATGTLRWNHLYGDKLFSNTSLIFSNYDYSINTNLGGTEGSIISRIQNYNLKLDFQYFASSKHRLEFGFNSIYHRIIPGAITAETESAINELNLTNKFAWENATYISHSYKPNNILSFEYGLRFSTFSPVGPGTFYTYDETDEIADSTMYSSGQFVTTYVNLEPRFSSKYMINEQSSVKAAYARNTQNLHLLSNSTSGNPNDLWIPSSLNVKPEIADQVSLGYFRNFRDNTWEFSTEVYYKNLQNQIDYKDGAELQFNENVESQLLFGTGRAYGIEFFIKKEYGRLSGWLGYTLSRTEKKIEGVNNGNYYPAKQDRTHDMSVVAMYKPSPAWTLSATWVYYTGNAVTFPSGKYEVAEEVINYYTERNGYRMPDYHRLDVGITWQRRKTGRYESSWNFSIYNAYGRENAYTITFEENPDDPTKTQAVQTTLFRWIPSISYNFKF